MMYVEFSKEIPKRTGALDANGTGAFGYAFDDDLCRKNV